MMRWSLRRRRLRTGNANPSANWPDAFRPGANHQADAAALQGYPPVDGRPMAQGDQWQGSPSAGYWRMPTFTALPRADAAAPPPPGAWPAICEQFSLHLLTLAEQLRISLDELEADEADPERLQRLYRIDHAATRMRRVSRDLRTLAGRAREELEGPVTSLLDVIRVALSAIERYTQVSVARVADLAVLGYAADDVGSLLAALLDNATRYSPGTVTVSAHLTGDGSVLLRVEDTGIGIEPGTVASTNAMLSGPVRDIDERTGVRTGFPVVHRIARKHQIGVRLATRPSPATGTIAMVTLPAQLLCELPDIELGRPGPPPAPRPPAEVTVLPGSAWRRPAAPQRPEPSRQSDWAAAAGEAEPADEPVLSGGLPRRERASLRGDSPRPDSNGTDSEPSPELSAEIQAAARRAFADDITAFSLGSQQPTREGTVP